jgi:hypothetical protein
MGKQGRKSMWDTPAPETAAAKPAASGWGGDKPQVAPQPPAAVPVVEQLRVVEKKQRDRGWEKEESNRPMLFRRVPPLLRQAIKEIADDLQVRVDDVARAFLEFGLQCYQKNEIQVQPVLSEGRLTLFPRPDDHWNKNVLPGWYERVWEQQLPAKKSRKTSKSGDGHEKPWKWQVSYRGIPAEVQLALREIHQKKSIPLGEVATLFLGHSLDAYRTGRLVLNPQPRQPAGLIVEVK